MRRWQLFMTFERHFPEKMTDARHGRPCIGALVGLEIEEVRNMVKRWRLSQRRACF